MEPVFAFYAALAALAVGQASLMLLQTYEHARFCRSRLQDDRSRSYQPRVEVIVPCKGIDPRFDSLLQLLLEQEYPLYGVTFVVESAREPVYRILQPILAVPARLRLRMLIAGQASECGQKVHNLSFATASLEPSVEVLAFLDSDVCLTRDWLSRLVERLDKPEVGAVTGYRWFVPDEKDWPSAVLSALNAPVALTLGNHRWNAIWGGCWAIRRSTFEQTAIRQRWQAALTEDYPAWMALRRAGLHVAFEPGCLLASPVQCTWKGLLEFARRQYVITRVYAPRFWWLSLLGALSFNVAFWTGVAIEANHWVTQGDWTWISFVLLMLYILATARAWLRQSVATARFPAWREALLTSRRLDIWGQPVLSLFNLGLILASAFGRKITWRGIRYRLDGPYRTRILGDRSAHITPEG